MRKVEQQLIQRILSKDRSAFDTLFQSYYSTLVFIATDILCNRQIAEEVVQDVFIKLWKRGSNLSIDISLSSYLTTMVRNRSIDYLRANEHKIKTISIESHEARLQLHCLGVSFEEELFSDAKDIAMKRAIEQLPPQCRKIFTLNRFDGLSHKEISEKLNISVSTVKTQITRALQKLKEKFDSL